VSSASFHGIGVNAYKVDCTNLFDTREQCIMKNFLLRILPMNSHFYNFCKGYVEKHDGDCNADMMTNGEYRILGQFLPGCSVVFDIGAYVGEWTNHALEINPHLQIHCFEPGKDNFAKLTANVKSNRAVCNPFGLSSSKREQSFFRFLAVSSG
jgi:hypothetical protein